MEPKKENTMKKVLLIAISSLALAACASSKADHASCPHKNRHHEMQEEKSPAPATSGAEPSSDNDGMVTKAAGFGTDTGEPTQK